MKNYLHRLLLKIIDKTTRFVAKFHFPFTHKKITSKHYREVQALMKPGQTILSRVDGELSTFFIPGEFGHAAIVKDKYSVIEATTHGVVETDLIDFVMKKDRIALLEPMFANEEEMRDAVLLAQLQKGRPYDFTMEFSFHNVKSFYCSELVYYAYLKSCANSPFKLREVLGVQTVAPSDFIEATDKFKLLYKSK